MAIMRGTMRNERKRTIVQIAAGGKALYALCRMPWGRACRILKHGLTLGWFWCRIPT
jgi:hypothetical protein